MFGFKRDLVNYFGRIKNEMSSRTLVPTSRIDSGLAIKVADSRMELHEIQNFLQETKGNYIEKSVFNFMPTTTWIVMKKNKRVVGVASLVADSAMGIPIEARMNLTLSRGKYSRIAQVQDFVFSSEGILDSGLRLWLFKYILIYATKLKRIDLIIFDSRNSHLLEIARAVGLPLLQGEPCLERLSWKQALMQSNGLAFSNRKVEMKDFLLSSAGEEIFSFPEREYFCSNDPCLDPDSFEKLFNSKNSISKNLNEAQRLVLRNSYPSEIYREALPKVENVPAWLDLRKMRSETYGQAFDMDAQKEVEILRASESGLLIFTKQSDSVRMPRYMNLKCHIGNGHFASVRGKIVSRIGQSLIGVEITECDSAWLELNDFALKPFRKLG